MQTFQEVSYLLRTGQYPWGASRRIYVDKPGQKGKLRPITIPLHGYNIIVQSAITMILEAIYEPWFDKTNRSFGFRARKGVYDAIHCLCLANYKTRGLHIAIEGDIKSAYDKVCREKRIEILGRKIKDRKFLALIHTRLDYPFWDNKEQKYITEKEGIPQGGIYSPYLWNIYIM
jgi:retron-type reverse transcriptase